MNHASKPHIMHDVLEAARQVRRDYGPGLPESAYEFAMLSELRRRGLHAERKGSDRSTAAVWVENCLLLGLRCVDRVTRQHSQQLSSELRKLRCPQGLLLNFNSAFVRQGAYPVSL